MNKGGNILDLFYIVLTVVVLAIVFMASWYIMSQVQPDLDAHLNNDVASNASANALQAIASFDYLLIFIIVGLLIATIISAFFIDTHPVFFVMSLLLFIMFMIVVPVLSNVFDGFATNSQMITAADEFDVTTSFVGELPKYFVVMGGLVLIALYAKYRTGGGEQI